VTLSGSHTQQDPTTTCRSDTRRLLGDHSWAEGEDILSLVGTITHLFQIILTIIEGLMLLNAQILLVAMFKKGSLHSRRPMKYTQPSIMKVECMQFLLQVALSGPPIDPQHYPQTQMICNPKLKTGSIASASSIFRYIHSSFTSVFTVLVPTLCNLNVK
jgi:hypothetical protein